MISADTPMIVSDCATPPVTLFEPKVSFIIAMQYRAKAAHARIAIKPSTIARVIFLKIDHPELSMNFIKVILHQEFVIVNDAKRELNSSLFALT